MQHEPLVITIAIDWPDLSPDDVELLDEVVEAVGWNGSLADRLEDLRRRVARMLLTAVEKP